MTRFPGSHRPLRAGLGIAVTAAIILLAPTPAHAASGDPIVVTFTSEKDTIEFGSYWSVQVETKNTSCSRYTGCNDRLKVSMIGDNGQTRSFTKKLWTYGAYFSKDDLKGPLPPGVYTVTATTGGDVYHNPVMDPDNEPFVLTVEKAALTVDFRVDGDPHQSRGAVVNAQLGGTFIEQYEQCYNEASCHAPPPDGTWKFAVTNSDGEIVSEKSIATKGPASRFASYYWHDIPADSTFEATASFTIAGDSASSYAIEKPTAVSFTSPEAPEAGEDGSTEPPMVEEVVPAGPSVPLWSVIGWFGVLLILLIAIAIFALSGRRRAAPASVEISEGNEQ